MMSQGKPFPAAESAIKRHGGGNVSNTFEEHQEACVVIWMKEEEGSWRGGQRGNKSREDRKTYDFHIHSVANGTCRVLSKGMKCLVCLLYLLS